MAAAASQSKNLTVVSSTVNSDQASTVPDSEYVCIFCGEQNDEFTEEGLDVHYWKNCPLLKRCQYCRQVVEVSGLTAHLLSECDCSSDFVQCYQCFEAIHSKHYQQHMRDKSCPPAEPGMSRCPLCHRNIASSEQSWRTHLMSPGADGCPENSRRKRQLQHSPDKKGAHLSAAVKSTNKSSSSKSSRSSPVKGK